MTTVRDASGHEIDFEAVVNLMDDEIREELHDRLAPCTNQEFFERYALEHERRHGEQFAPYAGGAW